MSFVSPANANRQSRLPRPGVTHANAIGFATTRIDDMTWVILTGRQSDLDQVATPHKIITNRDYLAHPALFRGQRPKVINLSNNYGYQSRGYYASLLASLAQPPRHPDGRDDDRPVGAQALRARAAGTGGGAQQVPQGSRRRLSAPSVSIFFGIGPSKAWDRFAKLLFDWFRAPALEVTIRESAEWASIRKIALLPLVRMDAGREDAVPGLARHLYRPRMARHQGANAGPLQLRHADRSA